MHVLKDNGECPNCHMDVKKYKPSPRYLLVGTILADRYVLGRVLGAGSFGITYLAWDKILEVPVAVKEYYPSDIVNRDVIRGTDLNVYADENKAEYDKKLKKFIEEARCLARFSSLDGIVSVQDFFYANNTAYIIMKYVEGASIKNYVKTKGKMEGQEVLNLMKPILMSLYKIHGTGLMHRDISPDNILFCEEEKLVLIDFGSARVQDAIEQRSMTVLFKRGFSPEEQYRPRGKQGAWSDIYAICATMYFMLTGKVPLDAIERMAGEVIKPLTDMPEVNIPIKAKEAIMKGMSVRAEDRYQDVSELMADIYEEGKIPVKPHNTGKRKTISAIVCAVCVIAIAAIVYVALKKGDDSHAVGSVPYVSHMPEVSAMPKETQPPETTVIPEEIKLPAAETPRKAKKKPKATNTPKPTKTSKPSAPKITTAPKNNKPKRSDGFIGIID